MHSCKIFIVLLPEQYLTSKLLIQRKVILFFFYLLVIVKHLVPFKTIKILEL